jgi:hypothetical protein
MKVEILIPVKQFANIKFFVEAKSEKELDEKIKRLWAKYYNFFEFKENIYHKQDLKAESIYDFVNDLQGEADEEAQNNGLEKN